MTMNEHNESKTFSGVYDVTSHVRQTPEENQIDRLETPKYEDLDLKVQLNNDSEVIVEMNGLVYPVDTGLDFEAIPENIYIYDDLVLKRKTNSRRKIKKSPFHREQTNCRLWEFIRDLLCNPRYNPDIVTWSNKEEGEFRVVKTKEIAKMWGKKKNNEGMTYEKLSRALRYYYKTKILMPVIGKRLIYQFGPSSYGWK